LLIALHANTTTAQTASSPTNTSSTIAQAGNSYFDFAYPELLLLLLPPLPPLLLLTTALNEEEIEPRQGSSCGMHIPLDLHHRQPTIAAQLPESSPATHSAH
jgi:hypothetical protein